MGSVKPFGHGLTAKHPSLRNPPAVVIFQLLSEGIKGGRSSFEQQFLSREAAQARQEDDCAFVPARKPFRCNRPFLAGHVFR